MPRIPNKRIYAAKATALIVLMAVGFYLQTHPMDQHAMAEIVAPLTSLG